MKTYDEAVYEVAKNAFTNYMGGGDERPRGTGLVAFIFEKMPAEVNDDAYKAFQGMVEKHREGRKI